MYYHAPFDIANRSVSSAVHGACGASSAAASPPLPAFSGPPGDGSSRSGGGITVGEGLLNGRRLVVRVAAPPTASVTPAVSTPMNATGGTVATASRWPSGDNPPLNLDSGLHVNPSHSPTVKSPTSTTNAPAGMAGASSGYGKGIVRISELRRQGVLSVESGLRLATLPSSRPVTTAASNHSNGIADGAANLDTDIPSRDSVQAGTTAPRRTPRRGPAPQGAVVSSPLSSRRTRGGRGSATPGDSGHRRGRGGRSSRSRASADVTLREDGQLCDHRWYTARGRRCFVYDGRTYTGSSAHRMWEKVKEAARRRDLTQSQRAVTALHAAATPHSRTRTNTGPTYRTTLAPDAVSRLHQASARARSAAEHAFLSQQKALRSTSTSQKSTLEATAPVSTRVPDEWRTLMEELGVLSDNETEANAIGRAGQHSGVTGDPQLPQRTRSVLSHAAPPRCDAISANSTNAEGVIEISDSDATNEDTIGSDSGASGDSPPTISPAEGNTEAHHEGPITAKVRTAPPLEWPFTSYFSDVSSGWSSTSSPTQSPAHPSAPQPSRSPKRKRVKNEPTRVFADLSTKSTPARISSYHGVQVVEQGGWMYPVEVYTLQQQQQQQRKGEKVAQKLPSAVSFGPLRGVKSDCDPPSMACSAEDVPLADLYRDKVIACINTTPAEPSSHLVPPPVPLSSSNPPAGLTVVSGNGATVPARPSTVSGAIQPRLLSTSSARSIDAGKGAASAFLGADDNLDDFDTADLADMFVTGEEIGGVRYEF
ncbi:hypothetical protein JKF63_03539 [Porcisia hertigi]|uniref:Uncharacterized protein n=1 Tax=Porcisia hertigi TaxID=2761500 RepID=A0A836HWQ2_9TRYP|nr:hypothetical protein JKF63_03539 [Porcisia hertigi]